ncbi:MAG TPA: hypothetical protein VF624_02970 [Tepidisphaeraceae bacterium]
MTLSNLRDWLGAPLIDDTSDEKPFRVRRGSAALIALGWVCFGAACLLGAWAVRSGMPVYSSFDFTHGLVTDGGTVILRLAPDSVRDFATFKILVHIGEILGTTLFSLGLLSIVLMNRRDRARTWRPRAL